MRQVFLILLMLVGCAPVPPPIEPVLQAATTIPTLDGNDAIVLCDTIVQQENGDLPRLIASLEELQRQNVSCGEITVAEALYDAYVRYGEQLEQLGSTEEAVNAYTNALDYTATNARARDALTRLGATTQPSNILPTCDEDTLSLVETIPTYTPSTGPFITLSSNLFMVGEQPITIRGVIYEPRDYPGERFFAEVPEEVVNEELFLIASSGLNTIRIYLHHDVLFQCPGNGAVPVPPAITRLDQVLTAASTRNLRVIMVLNHQSEPMLYQSLPHTNAQITYLVERYANEPAVLAWDLRDGGDLDYTRGGVERDSVLTWLSATTQAIRQNAPNQLVTAGWRSDSAATAPFVDFVSFQHYGSLDDLRQEIALLQSQTEKPLFLAGVGYPMVNGDELTQRDSIYDAVLATENNALLGWSVYSAFDHPRTVCEDCEQFGLWYTNYSPKLALDAISTVISD